MSGPGCERLTFEELTDYAAGELSLAQAATVEEHLFACADCGARAAALDELLRATRAAVSTGEVGGFMTEDVLNRLAREGVRVRSFALSPGAVVPCAVWDDDDLLALRLRGDFAGAGELTMTQWVAGNEVARVTGQPPAASPGEIIYVTPAAWIRQLPVVEVEVRISARAGDEERPAGSYTLLHGGSLHRSRRI